MARTKAKTKTRKVWADIIAILLLGVWAYFADAVIEGAHMEAIDYPLIGKMIADVVSVNKVWVFLIGIFFYLMTSSFAMSRFIGWMSSMIVMTEIMIVEPLRKFSDLVGSIKAANPDDPLLSDARMALERYGTFPWESGAKWMKLLTFIGALLLVFLLVYFIVIVVKDRKAKNTTRKATRNSLIFIAILIVLIFVPGLIMKTGPQWLFVSFMTLLAWLSYIYGVIKRSNKETHVAAAAVTIVLMLVLMFLDMCYRVGSAALAI